MSTTAFIKDPKLTAGMKFPKKRGSWITTPVRETSPEIVRHQQLPKVNDGSGIHGIWKFKAISGSDHMPVPGMPIYVHDHRASSPGSPSPVIIEARNIRQTAVYDTQNVYNFDSPSHPAEPGMYIDDEVTSPDGSAVKQRRLDGHTRIVGYEWHFECLVLVPFSTIWSDPKIREWNALVASIASGEKKVEDL